MNRDVMFIALNFTDNFRLWVIAVRSQQKADLLYWLNSLKNSDKLYYGRQIKISETKKLRQDIFAGQYKFQYKTYYWNIF